MDTRTVVDELRHLGVVAGSRKIVKKLAHPWLEWGVLVAFLVPTVPVALRPPPGVALRELAWADVDAAALRFGRRADEIAARLERGDRAFGAFAGGSLVHMRWGSLHPTAVPEVNLWISPGPGETYVYDVATAPEWRGRRIERVVRRAMNADLAVRGLRAMLSYVRVDNRPMLRALGQDGPSGGEVARIGYLRCAGQEPLRIGAIRLPFSPCPALRTDGRWPGIAIAVG